MCREEEVLHAYIYVYVCFKIITFLVRNGHGLCVFSQIEIDVLNVKSDPRRGVIMFYFFDIRNT